MANSYQILNDYNAIYRIILNQLMRDSGRYSNNAEQYEDKISKIIYKNGKKLTGKDKQNVSYWKKMVSQYRKKAKSMDPLIKSVENLYHFSDYDAYNFDKKLIDNFRSIAPILSENERKKFSNLVNASLKQRSKKVCAEIHSKTHTAISASHLAPKSVLKITIDYPQTYSLNELLKRAEMSKIAQLKSDYFCFFEKDKQKPTISLGFQDEMFLNNFNRMIEKHRNDSAYMRKLVSQYVDIKSLMQQKAELDYYSHILNSIKEELIIVNEINVRPILSFINRIYNTNAKKLNQVVNMLKKYHLEDLRYRVGEFVKQEEENEHKDFIQETYKQLAYTYIKLQKEKPEAKEEIEKAKKEMDEYAVEQHFDRNTQAYLISVASDRLRSEMFEQEADREYAVQRFKNGSTVVDSKIQEKATTIYREYIKYRARLKNKEECISFKDYAKQYYGEQDLSIEMVEPAARAHR